MSEELQIEKYKHRTVFLPMIHMQKIKGKKIIYAKDNQEEDII